MAIREYTLGPKEKTRIIYSDDELGLAKLTKRVAKWIKWAEESGLYPHEVSIRMNEDGYVAEIKYAEF